MKTSPSGWRALVIASPPGTCPPGLLQEVIQDINKAQGQIGKYPSRGPIVNIFQQQLSTPRPLAQGSGPEFNSNAVCDHLLHMARIFTPAIRIMLSSHLSVPGLEFIIIEGNGILPESIDLNELPELDQFRGIPVREDIFTVFLLESDRDDFNNNLLAHFPEYGQLPTVLQREVLDGYWEFGQYISQATRRHGIPHLPPTQVFSLLDRMFSI